MFEKWWSKGNKYLGILNYKKEWSINGVGRRWGITTNGAKRKYGHTCFCLDIHLGYVNISYTNWNLQGR